MNEPRYPFTVEQVMPVLRDVVRDFGREHKYEAMKGDNGFCRYVHHDARIGEPIKGEAAPGCLVAQVLHRLGVPLEVLVKVEGLSAEQLAQEVQCRRKGLDRTLVTAKAGAVLRAAQWPQDNGAPWGICLNAAEKELELDGVTA